MASKKIRHNELKLNYLHDDVWYDKDMLMLHFSFELLVRFVDDEMSKDSTTNWEVEPRKSARVEIMELYEWWIKYRGRDVMLTTNNYRYENWQLQRLVKIREYMWT